MRDRAITVWLTGIPGSGKSTLLHLLAEAYRKAGRPILEFDADVIRPMLWPELGWSPQERDINVSRLAHLASHSNRQGVSAVIAAVSPCRAARRRARQVVERSGHTFLEVWVSCSPSTCAERDPKGLYQRLARGEVSGIPGTDDEYSPPMEKFITISTEAVSPLESLSTLLTEVEAKWLP